MGRKEYDLAEGWVFALNSRDEQAFRAVRLPHDWAVGTAFDRDMEEGASQGYRSRFGIGWYRRKLILAQKAEGFRYLLSFGGIYENSTVWVNGEEAGGRGYGYSSFVLDITDFLHRGVNQLEVRVDNTQRPSDRWYSGAGIYRSVKLIEVEEEHLDPWAVTVHTQLSGTTAKLSIRCGLSGNTAQEGILSGNAVSEDSTQKNDLPGNDASENGERESVRPGNTVTETGEGENSSSERAVPERGPGRRVRVELAAKDGSLKTETEGDSEALELTVENPRLWSAEDPALYILTLSLLDGKRIADQIHFPIGLRTVEISSAQGMVVNGRKVRLKGVCVHQDVGCLGTAATKEIFRQRLSALKELGCNAIRPAHHTFSEDFLDLCDEMGFYVYEECFDKWHGGLYGRYFRTQWKKDVDAMVRRDRNRPCIIMWGVGNEVENQGQESMLETLKMLTEYVRTLDDRPVTCAMNPHFKREDRTDLTRIRDIQQFVDEVSDTEIYDNDERVERIAAIARYVDVLACNYQEQWYPLIHERIPDKPILGTEVYQYFMGDLDQMQNFTDTNPVLAAQSLDYVIGSFIWTGIDYLGESMGYPAKGWGGSLIRTNGSRRPGYYLMQSYWSEEPMVHFSVMDYSLEDEGVKEHWDTPMLADHWHFPQFRRTVIPYVIMSNCQEVRLWLNGKRIYIPHPAECRNRVITGFLPWLPGRVEAAGFREGKEVCRHSLITPGPAVQLRFMGDAWTFRGVNGGEPVWGSDAAHCNAKAKEMPAAEYPPRSQDTGCPAGSVVQPGRQLQLSVGACDMDGNFCFRESAKVHFHVEGPAEILAVDAGEITGGETYQGDSIHMYRGQASVMLAFTGDSGRVCVYAEAEGLRTARMTMNVPDQRS